MATSRSSTDNRRPPYQPAVTPALRRLLGVLLLLVALIGANSLYLVTVTCIEELTSRSYQNFFYQYMFLAHLVLGLVLIAPFLIFSFYHMRNTWRRKNRRAVRMGYALFFASLILLATGLLLTRAGPLEIRSPTTRQFFYWLHVLSPLVILWFYWLHRLAGPPIKWKLGIGYLAAAGATCIVMIAMHSSDPRGWYQVGSKTGETYFEPSLARTDTGKFIPQEVLMNDQYCKECHADSHADWAQSAHRFSSFNNPAYLVSVRETRDVSLQKDGDTKRVRWCAGCHDPVPFFSGQLDNPQFNDVDNPTAHAGITCTVCHAITNVNSPRGNADYTIEEPLHYPFAFSKNPALKWVNKQLVKAKPSFHKKTFLKPFHQEADFCSVCHKVHLPETVNDYKFLRGQNHHDSFLLSGVSGHGARSFYYPKRAEQNCNGCHMPLKPSDDFGAKPFDTTTVPSIHNHLFLGANTALPHWHGHTQVLEAHQDFLKDCVRVDIFGLREGGTIEGKLVAPLRPDRPQLEPGKRYLLEVVIRTLSLGHHFTQGTADSNEIWLEIIARQEGKIVGRSGQLDQQSEVDPWSHFVNVFMLDREGYRINRRNAQDIFIPLYNHQIPPGAGQTVHYGLDVPVGSTAPLEIEVKLQYRKFNQEYMRIVAKHLSLEDPSIGQEATPDRYHNDLPITTLAEDRILLPVVGGTASADQIQAFESPNRIPVWQRWNDYGIGSLLKGKAELRQASEAFEQVAKLNRYDGPLNLARVLFREGRLDEATTAIRQAAQHTNPPPPAWTLAWLSGLVNRQQGRLDEAEENFRSILEERTQEQIDRGFDFSQDYEIINLLGQTLFEKSRAMRGESRRAEKDQLIDESITWFQRTLVIDPENVTAHYNLQLLYAAKGDASQQTHHQQMHLKYKPDDNARDRAVAAARQRYPAANHAANAVVVYDLLRSISPSPPTASTDALRLPEREPVLEASTP
ncbi:MAG: multiheme c-type cytochrome [Pirellulaceae bacterium]|nr:multiheme c-type cytochrome [Pirellulaceae bacterium]